MAAKNASSFDYEHSTVQLHRGDSTMAVYLSNLMGVDDSLVIEGSQIGRQCSEPKRDKKNA